jgi:hypothetical protein
VSGSSQSCTVLPPASRYRREAGISSGKPPPATEEHRAGRDLGIIGISEGDGFMPEIGRGPTAS